MAQYTKKQFADILAADNPQLKGLSVDAIVRIGIAERPDLEKSIIPDPVAAPVTPAAPTFGTSMKELAERAAKFTRPVISAIKEVAPLSIKEAAKAVKTPLITPPYTPEILAKQADIVTTAKAQEQKIIPSERVIRPAIGKAYAKTIGKLAGGLATPFVRDKKLKEEVEDTATSKEVEKFGSTISNIIPLTPIEAAEFYTFGKLIGAGVKTGILGVSRMLPKQTFKAFVPSDKWGQFNKGWEKLNERLVKSIKTKYPEMNDSEVKAMSKNMANDFAKSMVDSKMDFFRGRLKPAAEPVKPKPPAKEKPLTVAELRKQLIELKPPEVTKPSVVPVKPIIEPVTAAKPTIKKPIVPVEPGIVPVKPKTLAELKAEVSAFKPPAAAPKETGLAKLSTDDLEKLIEAKYTLKAPQKEIDVLETEFAKRISEEDIAKPQAEAILKETPGVEDMAVSEGVSVDEQLSAAYANWLKPVKERIGITEDKDLLENMVDIIQDEAKGKAINLTKENVLAAAKDAYEYKRGVIEKLKKAKPSSIEELKAQISALKGPSAKEERLGLSSKDMGVTLPLEEAPKLAKTIFKNDIRQYVQDVFKIPIKGKSSIRFGKAIGLYFPRTNIIREKVWGDIDVLAHEVAHGIDAVLIKRDFKKLFSKEANRELRGLDYDQRKRRQFEGFAEWFRYLVTTDKADILAPNFTREFNQLITGTDMVKKVKDFKSMFKQWHGMGATRRIKAHIDMRGETIKKPLITKAQEAADRFKDNWIDENAVLERIEKQAGIDPLKTDKVTPFQLATYSKGKANAIAHTFVYRAAIDEVGNVVGPSLMEALEPAFDFTRLGLVDRDSFVNFLAYGVSRRGLLKSKQGIETGMDVEDMKYVVDRFKNPKWDLALDNVTKWYDNLMAWPYRAGAFTNAEWKAMKEANPVYLSFARVLNEEWMGRGKTGTILRPGKPTQKMTGSGRPIKNPIEFAIPHAAKIVATGQKMAIARAMAEFAEAYPKTYGQYVTEVPAPTKVTTFTAGKLKNYLESEGIDIADLDMDKMVSVFQQDFKGKGNIVPIVGRDGVRRFYEIDPKLYSTFEGIDPLQLGPLMKVLSPFSRLQRLGATGLNATFSLIRNPFRDITSFAAYNSYTGNPFKIVGDPIKGMVTGILGKPGEIPWRFKAAGGELVTQTGFDRDLSYAAFDEMLLLSGGLAGKTLHVAKHPIDSIRALINFPELGPRIAETTGAYDKLKKEHPEWSEEKLFITSFSRGQDLLNFTRSGRFGKKVNQSNAFFNSNIQGAEKVYREAKAHPGLFVAKGLTYLTTPALATWWVNKDKQWYKNLPHSYRLNNIFIETPGAVVRLPIPFELGAIFMAGPVAMADYLYRRDPDVFKGYGKLLKGQAPTIAPSALGPLWDVRGDKNWLDRPIEGKRLKELPVEERKREHTTGLATEVSKGFRLFGIPVSPVQMDYLISSYTGGLPYKLGVLRPIKEAADLPVIGGAILRSPEMPRRQIEDFYKGYTKLRQLSTADKATHRQKWQLERMKDAIKAIKPRFEKIREYQKSGDIKKRDEEFIRLRKRLDRVKKTIKKV